MDIFDTIHERRSIRNYSQEDVSDEHIDKILRAGMTAPSAGNQQVWRFVVIRERSTMLAVTEFHPYARMLDHAPVCIAALADTRIERYRGYWVQDVSAAMENMLLAACALKLGAVWLGIHPIPEREEGMRKLLNLPAGVECLGLIALGHPASPSPGPMDRFNAEYVHSEKW